MRLTQMIEALLFASDAPLAASDFCRIDDRLDEDTVSAVIEELRTEYDRDERSFQIYEIGGGYQLLTRPEYAAVVERFDTVPQSSRLSVPALEVLAIIAYRQPLGRAEVEEIRGVQSSAVLRTLQDRELIEAVGRSEGLGRPLLYGTTRKFLEHFGFRSLEDLPRPDELPIVLLSRPVDAPVTEPQPPGAAAEPTPLSAEAAAEAEALHIPVPDELKVALEAEAAAAESEAAPEDVEAAAGEDVVESEAASLHE
jgi:segregation and condensation protein B